MNIQMMFAKLLPNGPMKAGLVMAEHFANVLGTVAAETDEGKSYRAAINKQKGIGRVVPLVVTAMASAIQSQKVRRWEDVDWDPVLPFPDGPLRDTIKASFEEQEGDIGDAANQAKVILKAIESVDWTTMLMAHVANKPQAQPDEPAPVRGIGQRLTRRL